MGAREAPPARHRPIAAIPATQAPDVMSARRLMALLASMDISFLADRSGRTSLAYEYRLDRHHCL
jgi:hypothetical protein